MPDLLVVSTQRRYVFDEIAGAAHAASLPVVRDLGLDVPSLPAGSSPAWWAPSAHAVRLVLEGLPLSLSAPGPRFLELLPERFRGRPVRVVRLDEVSGALFPSFVKPAESKLEALPAAWWDDCERFVSAALSAGLLPDSLVQFSAPLEIRSEFRFLVARGVVLAGAPYRVGDDLYFPGLAAPPGDLEAARSLVVELLEEVPVPPGLTVDVAVLASGRPVVVEPNPAWCAYWYDCPPAAALEAVVAATDPALVGGWAYRPDRLLLERAARMRPLPRRLS